jgi:TctA family transporter
MDGSLAAALSAVAQIADPFRLLMLCCGVLMGLVVGVVPGLGGLVGLTLLLPFTFALDPYTALAVLIGMHAVVATSDSIPAILFGVPGTVGSAATVVDGYPMARNGEAGRAMGAAFTASMLGGLFGVFLLAALIPVLRPLMLSIGSPEMLALCIFGLSLAAALSGKYMLPGLAAAAVGLILSMVGEDYQSGTMRWTFGTLYMWDGIPLVPLALGLFALPEIADLAVRRTSIAGGNAASMSGRSQGFRDVLRNPVVFLRSSSIGAVLGAMPGLGSAVIDWIAYGATANGRAKNPRFGEGDVRGVIASEAANNAKEGGALVPTIAFGVPGSASMAILLGAFLVHGITPGPDMLTTDLDITYTLIISVAVANILGAGLCFLFAPSLARIALIPIGILAPVVLGITFVGAFQGAQNWGDLVVLLGAGVLGYIMRLFSWPRPPLLLGFVLGVLIERYLATSLQVYGWEFLLRPAVAAILILTLWGLLSPVWRPMLERLRKGRPQKVLRFGFRADRIGAEPLFAALIGVFFVALLIDVADWPRGARVVPQIVGWAGVLIMALHLGRKLFVTTEETTQTLAMQTPDGVAIATGGAGGGKDSDRGNRKSHMDLKVEHEGLDAATITRRSVDYFAWLFGYAALAALIGPILAVPIWVAAYMILCFGTKWQTAIPVAAILFVVIYSLFEFLLNITFPRPFWPIL